MKHRGLIFCGDLVPGVMNGTVTVTSRVIKPQPDGMCQDEPYWHVGGYRLREGALYPLCCPFRVGERRYVKEAWAYWGAVVEPVSESVVVYRGDADQSGVHWRSSMFMPRWAARTWIEITAVWPARCWDMIWSEIQQSMGELLPKWYSPTDAVSVYSALWDRLNRARGFPWTANPWVWRCAFRLCEAPKKTEMTSEKV